MLIGPLSLCREHFVSACDRGSVGHEQAGDEFAVAVGVHDDGVAFAIRQAGGGLMTARYHGLIVLPAFGTTYLLTALGGTPDVLDALLVHQIADDAVWDARPDPERFSLREIVAHLADWENVFLERLVRTRDEQTPMLPIVDPERLARERDYARHDPHQDLARFRAGRERLVGVLRALEPAQWERAGQIVRGDPPVSHRVTLEAWAVQALAHDGYHTQQVARCLDGRAG